MKPSGKNNFIVSILFLIMIIFNGCTQHYLNPFGGKALNASQSKTQYPTYQNDSLKFKIDFWGNYHPFAVNGVYKKAEIEKLFRSFALKSNILLGTSYFKTNNTSVSIWALDSTKNHYFSRKAIRKSLKWGFWASTVGDIEIKENITFHFFSNKRSYLSNHSYEMVSYYSKDTLKELTIFYIPYSNYLLSFAWLTTIDRSTTKKLEKLNFENASNISQIMSTFDTLTNQKLEKPSNPFSIAYKSFGDNNYLGALDNLLTCKNQFDSTLKKRMYWQAIATYASFVDDDSLGKYLIKASGRKEILTKNAKDSIQNILKDYQPINAIEIIKKQSEFRQIVMLNENHYYPKNRAFADSLLVPLYESGYRYLAVEGLDYSDTLINERGYPIQSTGYYIKEPKFGNMLRHALKLGFKLVAYEDTTNCTSDDFMQCLNMRESNQAKNIKNILQINPQAKIFVYAGFDHIYKKTDDQWVHLAQYLKEHTGIAPLTIEQTQMIEKSDNDFENHYYRVLSENYNWKKPVIFKNQKQNFLLPDDLKEVVDFQIYHPRIENINNESKKEDLLSLKLPKNLSGNLIIQVFNKSEIDKETINRAIPIINKRFSEHTFTYNFCLKKGIYEVLVRDVEGQILYSNTISK